MDYIMNNNEIIISQMQPMQGHECLSACLGNIFNLFYSNVSGDKIIIAGNGIDVRYDMTSKIVDTPMYKANFVFLDQYNINYTHNCINNQNQTKEFLDNVLERKQFIVLKLDASFLSHSRVFNQTSNASHFLNILGKEDSMYQLSSRYEQYSEKFAKTIGCELDEIRPYVYMGVTAVANYMIFGEDDIIYPQIQIIKNKIKTLMSA